MVMYQNTANFDEEMHLALHTKKIVMNKLSKIYSQTLLFRNIRTVTELTYYANK